MSIIEASLAAANVAPNMELIEETSSTMQIQAQPIPKPIAETIVESSLEEENKVEQQAEPPIGQQQEEKTLSERQQEGEEDAEPFTFKK